VGAETSRQAYLICLGKAGTAGGQAAVVDDGQVRQPRGFGETGGATCDCATGLIVTNFNRIWVFQTQMGAKVWSFCTVLGYFEEPNEI
jgi:hypothetical protein